MCNEIYCKSNRRFDFVFFDNNMRKDIDNENSCAKLDKVENESAMTQLYTFKFQLFNSFLLTLFNYF